MARWIAQYECRACHHKWQEEAGPTQCPICNHLYIDWLNYDELKKKKRLVP